MDAFFRGAAAVGPLLVFLVCLFAAPGAARADGSFGDSTWVAPDEPFDADYTAEGPRVAPPDHERRWETVLRTPFRVAFFPLRLVGYGIEKTAGFVGPRYLDPKPSQIQKHHPKVGAAVAFGTGTDLRLGPSITWPGFPTAYDKVRVIGTISLTDHRHIRFSQTVGARRPVSVRFRADYDYKPTRRYYGIGNSTPDTDLSYFLLEGTEAEGALLFGSSALHQVRLLAGYSSQSPRHGYNRSPLLEEIFSDESVPGHRETKEFLAGVGADVSSIDGGRDPSSGLHGRAELRRAMGIRSSDPDYYLWWLEGRAYVPVFAKHRVLAFRTVYTGVDPSGDATLPFYRLAMSGGPAHFAGYTADRFRDRQLLLVRAEYRWAIVRRLSAVGLYEMGQVAPRASSFGIGRRHDSYGAGLRLGLDDEKAFRLEVAKSVEGIRGVLAVGSDF